MLYEGVGKKWVFGDCYVDKYKYWLHTLGNSEHVTFTLLSHATDKEETTEGQEVEGHQNHPLENVPATLGLDDGSYTLTCEAASPIHWSLREMLR